MSFNLVCRIILWLGLLWSVFLASAHAFLLFIVVSRPGDVIYFSGSPASAGFFYALPLLIGVVTRFACPTVMRTAIGRAYAIVTVVLYLIVLAAVIACRVQDVWIGFDSA